MKISIVLPVHNMENRSFFYERCIASIKKQTYKNYEIVETEDIGISKNTNNGIRKSTGDIIKFLYMDDYLANENSLQEIVDNWKGGWLATGCLHDDGSTVGQPHYPHWNDQMYFANNTIGSPSVVTIENKDPLFFDEGMSWTLDCDYYMRLFQRYGHPTILPTLNIIMGVGSHQVSSLLSGSQKRAEQKLMIERYAKN
jgi:glycosyltransferase involved in cell wall biosynthesis